MIKNKPLLITALVFGGLGLVFLSLSAASLLAGDGTITDAIASLFGQSKVHVTTASLGQFSVVFETAAFLLAFRSLQFD